MASVNLSGMDTLAPAGTDLESLLAARPMVPFSPEVIDFLAALSVDLLAHPEARRYPDVVTFGFWCRRASVSALRASTADARVRLGRGIVFHIAPGNVPVNFAYSMATGLLAGNANIVRLPSAPFPQVALICSTIDALLTSDAHRSLRHHLRLVRYEKQNSALTDLLSAQCDVRVIWGGDQTIADIRRSPLAERSFDITFADRYSVCVMNAGSVLALSNLRALVEGFYNDTYLFDQNACTAPHLVVWLGTDEAVLQAKELFWGELHAVVAAKYELQTVSAVDKLTAAYRYAASHSKCSLSPRADNLIVRMELDDLEAGIEDWRSNSGFFYEFHAAELEDLEKILNSRFQTLAYVGLPKEELQQFVVNSRSAGIDRIVPVGRTLDFSLDWDGHNLIDSLSRVIVVQ